MTIKKLPTKFTLVDNDFLSKHFIPIKDQRTQETRFVVHRDKMETLWRLAYPDMPYVK